MNKKRWGLIRFEWVIFILIMIVLFFSTQTFFGTASYPRVYRINIYCIVGFLFLLIVSNHGKLKYKVSEVYSYGIVMIPHIFLLVVSTILYAIYHRISLSNLIYYNINPILLCLMAIVAYRTFGNRAVRGILIAASINYISYIVICIAKYGPLSLLQAGSGTAASSLLEVHEITFVFGLIIIYLVVSGFFRNQKINKKWIFLIVVFCLLGFKRILIVAIILALIAYKVFHKCKNIRPILFVSIGIITITLLWVYMCSSWDILTGISTMLGVDLKGRNWIYSNFYPYYSFSISYTGAGIGYVQQLISDMTAMILKGHAIGLHNEFLRLFIELGFIPYIMYFVLLIPVMVSVINKKFGMKVAVIYFSLWMMTLICISTDNLLTYPNYMLAFGVIMLTAINTEKESQSKTDKGE